MTKRPHTPSAKRNDQEHERTGRDEIRPAPREPPAAGRALMAPRFYANPFVKDAPSVVVREVGEWRYSGMMHCIGGSCHVFVREVKYSDGSTRLDQEERPAEPIVRALRVDLKTYEADPMRAGCRHCRRPLRDHSGPTVPPDLCPNQAR